MLMPGPLASSVTMVFQEEECLQHAPSQSWGMTENENIFPCFLTPRTSSGHCMSIIISFIHITDIGDLMQGWPISVILEKTAVSFCIEPSICCFILPCIKLIFSGIILCYVMYVASSSISFASLLATSSNTENCVKSYVHAMLMYLMVSFEK